MKEKIGFWKWFGSKLGRGFVGFLLEGGWAIFPCAIHMILTSKTVWFWTSILWIIPMFVTMAYRWYLDFVKEDC